MTDNNTTPMRAVVLVAYCHEAEMDNDDIQGLIEDLVEVVDEYDSRQIQMATLEVLPLDADEAIEYHIEDLDDLDEDWEDMDDLREVYKHGSTPR